MVAWWIFSGGLVRFRPESPNFSLKHLLWRIGWNKDEVVRVRVRGRPEAAEIPPTAAERLGGVLHSSIGREGIS